MIRIVLWLLRLSRPLFAHLGVNSAQMEAIVRTKLTIDNRIERNGKSSHKTDHTLMKQAILMGIVGGFLFLYTYLLKSPIVSTLIFQSYLSIIVITSFMTEYSRLLFSTADNSITERFPVTDRTVLCARIVSMLSYLYLLTFSLALFPFCLLLFKTSIAVSLLFLLAVMVNTLFSLLLANVFYIFLMRYVSAEKFQQIITYTQILLVACIIIGYQSITKITPDLVDLSSPALWLFFTPPAYFMSFNEIFPAFGFYPLLLSGIGITLTVLLGLITLFGFSGSYLKNASAIDRTAPVKKRKQNEKLLLLLSRLCCREPLQTSGFLLTWRLTRNNLKFKQSVFPLMIYALAFNGIPLYQMYQNQGEVSFSSLLFPLYMLPYMCMGVIMNIGYSEQSNLLWIYKSRPLEQPGVLLLGCFKAVYMKYFFPFLIIIYAVYGVLSEPGIYPDLLLAFSLSTLFLIIFYRYSSLVFPFSKEKSTRESGSMIVKTFGSMFLLALLGLGHYFLHQIPWGVPAAIVISWGLIYAWAHQVRSLIFSKIESHY